MNAISTVFKFLFALALFIFLLELTRDSKGVSQVLNSFWSGISTGYKDESSAGGGQFKVGQK
jgi:hypothetical protein